MKKILILVSALIVLIGASVAAFFLFSDYSSMKADMPERRPDIRGIVQSIQNYQITVMPFDSEASPFKELSREEMREKMATLSQEERRLFREKMQESVLQEITIELSGDVSVYKKTKRLSQTAQRLEITGIEESNIVSVWLEPIEEGGLPTAEFITIFSPEFYNE